MVSKTIAVTGSAEDLVETVIDLSPALTNGRGHLILIVEPSGGSPSGDDDSEIAESWIQVTNIGLDAFADNTDLVGWVTSLKDGAPLSDVDVSLLPSDVAAKTGGDGLARLALKSTNSTPGLLVARRDGDVAILPERPSYANRDTGTWVRKPQIDSLRWFVFDDRKMYQPGEEVHVKGWIRRIGGGKTGDTDLFANAGTQVSYVLSDSRNNSVKNGTVQLNALGGFDFVVKLPDKVNLGTTTLKLQASTSLEGSHHAHRFEVQEFRRPEFEVKTQNESEGPFFVGAGADVSVNASYYAGGGLPNAPVRWVVYSATTQFTPPNRGDYIFGEWTPWWTRGRFRRRDTWQELKGVTDAGGKHRLHLDFDRVNPARPSTVSVSANVTDVNRQNLNSTTKLLVHPSSLYVGLKTDKTFFEQGQPLQVQTIVTDIDGNLVERRDVRMVATRLTWKQERDDWLEVETDPQECSIRSAASAVTCTFRPQVGGQYRVKATVRDDRERANETEFKVWVSGADTSPQRDVGEGVVQLIPSQKDYKTGDTAEILVQAPFFPAEGVLTVRRSGIVKVERFRMDQPTTTLRVPIEQGWTPNVHVQVDLLGEEEREDSETKPDAKPLPKQPAYASGSLKLSIPPLDRRLSIVATPRDKAIEPGGETRVNVEVKDASGAPVAGSEVAVVVVDEAVLALTDYTLDDPVSVFYPERTADVEDVHVRQSVWLSSTGALNYGGGNAGGGGGVELRRQRGDGYPTALAAAMVMNPPPAPNAPVISRGVLSGSAPQPIRIRQDFDALAVFAPAVPTDANGRAEVKVKLPDNLTRYRVMAVAVAGGKQFGAGESSITARIPLMVRASAPRFLNFGDTFEFPIVVQNQTDAAMSVDVALRASNAHVSGSNGPSTSPLAGRRVTVPANDRVELRIPVATSKAGTARFQVAAVGDRWSDAAEVSLPVWTPATTEAFATYGEIDDGAVSQPVKAPSEVVKEFGGLEIEASSTQLQQL
ncbi:MAG TPA: alpha-2-macroglobulin family protein, partial [Pyrinomonadaceae bacterium]|nr:alpha-2-macroglobulin family protein [Pyrinomonadaceae bacterium]